MRTGHKQGEMQLIAFTCRPRPNRKGRTAVSPKLCSEKQERRFLLLQCHTPPQGSTPFAAEGLLLFAFAFWAFTLGFLVWEVLGREKNY
jgi:hypothetical protein